LSLSIHVYLLWRNDYGYEKYTVLLALTILLALFALGSACNPTPKDDTGKKEPGVKTPPKGDGTISGTIAYAARRR